MEIREADGDDGAAIRTVTKRSLEASYSLSPSTIESAVEKWYSPDEFERKLEDDDVVLLVCESDGVVAFSESLLVAEGGQGDLLWLHVHPDYRGRGLARDVFEDTRERITEAGAEYLRGRVLADNQTGAAFFEERGFEKVDEERIEIDGDQYVEYIYTDAVSQQLRSMVTDSGSIVYIDMTEEEVGSDAPFHVVLADPNGEEKYGYFCTHCESLATAMSPDGRIQCGTCGNTRKPTRWDASYM